VGRFFKFFLQGILLKGGEVLDALAVCDTVAFDKTGTLTTGELICKAIEPLRGHGLQEPCCIPSCETEALAVATAMERGAIHPIARLVLTSLYLLLKLDPHSSLGALLLH